MIFSSRASRRWALAVACAATSFAPLVRAETSDKAVAEALFEDARGLMSEHRYAEACAKFAQSHALEPKLGTLLNLAACHEAIGRTASAWAEFTEAHSWAERVNQAERASFAREHADALAHALPRVVLHARLAPSGLSMTIDGVRVADAALGTALPLDPGAHKLAVSATGKRTWLTSLTIEPGASETTVEIPDLEEANVPLPAATTSPSPASSRGWRVPRAAGWTAVGIGAAAAVAGTYFGIRTFAEKSDAQHECTGAACSKTGLDRFDDAHHSATAANIAFGVSIASLAAGLVMLTVLADRSPTPASRLAVEW